MLITGSMRVIRNEVDIKDLTLKDNNESSKLLAQTAGPNKKRVNPVMFEFMIKGLCWTKTHSNNIINKHTKKKSISSR